MFTFKVKPIHFVATLPISKLNEYKKNAVHWHLGNKMAHFWSSCIKYWCFDLPEAAIGAVV